MSFGKGAITVKVEASKLLLRALKGFFCDIESVLLFGCVWGKVGVGSTRWGRSVILLGSRCGTGAVVVYWHGCRTDMLLTSFILCEVCDEPGNH